MKVIRSHKIKLNPTVKQRNLFAQAAGVKRKSFNWALAKWNEMYENGEKPSAMTLVKFQNSIKKEEFPYFSLVSKNVPQYAIWDVEDAWKKYFNGRKDGTIEKGKAAYIKSRLSKGLEISQDKLRNFGKPNFKKKGKGTDSFVAVENKEQFRQSNFKIHIPRVGKVKCFENLRFEGKVNNVVVKRIANDWFAIVNVEISKEAPMVSESQTTIGIDFGIKTMMTLSDGTIFENPKPLRKNLKSLQRLSRGLSRKVKYSENWEKQKRLIACKHQRIANIRHNAIHQATTAVVNKGHRVVIEDLNVASMIKNHKLAQALSDVSFSEIGRQLTYKCVEHGIELLKADRFFASSKTCSGCGNKKETLKLSERTYSCAQCGLVEDRDLNAAKNLANWSPTPSAGGSKACGERTALRQSSSGKQEINLLNVN